MEENGTGRNGCGQADESSSTFAHSLLLCDRSKRVCVHAQDTLGRSHGLAAIADVIVEHKENLRLRG